MRDYGITFTGTQLFLARVVKITRLDGHVLRIAEAELPITVSSQTFVPLPGCNISAVKHLINGGVGSVEIQFAHSQGGTLDTFQLNTGFWDGASVQMYVVDRSVVGGTLGDALFTGLIDTVLVDPIGSQGTFDIRGLSVTSEAFIQTYQPMCRTDLFSVLCGLDPDDWKQTATVGALLDRFNFTVTGLTTPPEDGWFNQGVFETASGFKGVMANWIQSSGKITTYLPVALARLVVGEGLTLYPGCDKTGFMCRERYHNKLNFQGEDHFLGVASIVGMPAG